jgi:transcriptional regulator with XRE-family HTH domain
MPMATLAKQAGISRGYWYLLLAGGRQPSTEVVERIASVLRVPERMVEHALGMPKVRRAKP